MNITTMALGAYQTNCYLVQHQGNLALIDPGDQGENLLSALEQEPNMVLITHGHYDHTGAVAKIRAKFPKIPVYLHPGDGEGADPSMFPLSTQIQDITPLKEGMEIPFGDLKFQVLETPGHSKGSVCLLIGEHLFTGDTLFRGSMGRTDFVGGDYQEIMKSLKRLSGLTGDLQVYPGHDRASTLDFERKNNPYVQESLKI